MNNFVSLVTMVGLLWTVSPFASAQEQTTLAYYDTATLVELERGSSDSEELKKTIEKAAKKNRKFLGYTEAKEFLFGQIDLEKEGSVYILKDVYCRRVLRSDEGWNIGPKVIPPNGEINCEHTWPQSRFNGAQSKTAQKGDLHHLFPTDSKANSVRGNYPFGEVNGKVAHDQCDISFIGSALEPDIDSNGRSRFFQPPAEHRGNVARALFYFSVLYHLPIEPTEETYLRRWHTEDPVDAKELKRNDAVMAVQGNRNPFVDYPELVARIEDF